MELGLRDKAVLVTGGTRGIGRAIALAYARDRARVAITYATDEAAATTVVQQIAAEGGSGVAARLDLAEPASIPAAVTETAERFGGLDVLVANAVRWPIDARGPLAESDPDVWSRALRANLEGTAATVRAALAYLSRSSAGRVVLVSSGVSRHGMAGATAYATAKAGLDGLIAALKWEAGQHDVLSTSSARASPSPRTTSQASPTTYGNPFASARLRDASPCPTTSPTRSCWSARRQTATSPAHTSQSRAASTEPEDGDRSCLVTVRNAPPARPSAACRCAAEDVMTRYGFASGTNRHGRRTGRYSPGQSAYASSASLVSLAADAPYFAATSLTG